MNEKIKFTEDEMNEIKYIQQKTKEITFDLGQITIDRFRVEDMMSQVKKAEDKLKDELKALLKLQNSFVEKVTKIYGNGELNPDTGIFTPIEKDNKIN